MLPCGWIQHCCYYLRTVYTLLKYLNVLLIFWISVSWIFLFTRRFKCVLMSRFYPLYEASTCCWFWFSPAARSAWRATLPALPWLSPSTLTPACESFHLGREMSEARCDKWSEEKVNTTAGTIIWMTGLDTFYTYSVCAYLATPADRFAPPATCVGFLVRPAAGLHWKLLHRRLMDHCFPEEHRRRWYAEIIVLLNRKPFHHFRWYGEETFSSWIIWKLLYWFQYAYSNTVIKRERLY